VIVVRVVCCLHQSVHFEESEDGEQFVMFEKAPVENKMTLMKSLIAYEEGTCWKGVYDGLSS